MQSINGNRNDSLRDIEEEFVKALIRKKYAVPARSDLPLILKEQDFQESGITDKAAINLGKLIDVQAIIIVNIEGGAGSKIKRAAKSHRNYSEERDNAEISARMVDIENGEIMWLGNTKSGPYFFAMARYLASAIPPAENAQNIFKEKWDYNKAEGYFVSSFDWSNVTKMIVQVKGLEKKEACKIEDELIAKLMENGYRVPSRSNVEAIIAEQNFNTSMLSAQALTSLGKLSNTNTMMIVWMGEINKIGDDSITVMNKKQYHYGSTCAIRVVDLEKSNIIWSGSLFADGWYTGSDSKKLYNELTTRLVASGLIPKKN